MATPTGLDFARVAELYGLPYARPPTLAELRSALGAPGLVHVRTDRAIELALARRLATAAAEAAGDFTSGRAGAPPA